MSDREIGPDLSGLEEFAKRTNREKALFFVERKHEIKDIAGAGARAFSTVMAGDLPEGQTRICAGRYGVGKTALLSRLREIWDADSAAPLPVLLDRKALNSEEVLAEKIVVVLNPKKLPEFRQTVT